MARRNRNYVSLSDLYLAYRKAKAEAFYENTHFHALAFSEYEMTLDDNLRALHARLLHPDASWTEDTVWLGGYSYAPKSVDLPAIDDTERVFYRFLDPMEEWRRQHGDSNGARLKANFRLVITPSVAFQVVSALWILKVGYKYDSALDPNLSFGNRVRRGREMEWTDAGVRPGINTDCIGLFAPYFSAYASWRAKGLAAMHSALDAGHRIVVVTMDLQRFYHRVSPKFLLRDSFLNAISVELDADQRKFTRQLIAATQSWYESTPDAMERPAGAIPVGLSASKIIANVLLAEFDRKIQAAVKPVYYGRYVDDIFMVVRLKDSPLTGDDVMHRLANQLPGMLKYKTRVPGESGAGLRVTLEYAKDSELLFTGSKQKVFNLSGSHGLDLVTQISEQIRRHSSEHRLLPLLPDSAEGMASRALLAQPSAALEADALRKADAISVRRLGLSSTVAKFQWSRARSFLSVLHSLRSIHDELKPPSSAARARKISVRLLHTDWGRRPYRDYWIHNGRRDLTNPTVPSLMSIRKVLHGVRAFRIEAKLRIPYWPAVVFPTWPLSLSEITLAAPSLVRDSKKLPKSLVCGSRRTNQRVGGHRSSSRRCGR